MVKKRSASSPRARLVSKTADEIRAYFKTPAGKKELAQTTRRLRAMKDSEIDFSDIPPLSEEQLARMVRRRPPRQGWEEAFRRAGSSARDPLLLEGAAANDADLRSLRGKRRRSIERDGEKGQEDPAAGLTVKCYWCREPIVLRKMPGRVWCTVDHICMSETAKAKRFPQLDEELQKLRAKVDELERRRERIDQMMETITEFSVQNEKGEWEPFVGRLKIVDEEKP